MEMRAESPATPPREERDRREVHAPSDRVLRAYRILQTAFVILPIGAGTTKVLHIFVNWEQYLSPTAIRVLGSHVHAFMRAAGVMEILIGIGMIFRPGIFSYVISAWLLGIILNLLLSGAYFDIALRDFALVLATFVLGELSQSFKNAGKS